MGLVHEKQVHAEVFKVDDIVPTLALGELAELVPVVVYRLLELLCREPILPLRMVGGDEGSLKLGQELPDDVRRQLRGRLDHSEGGMGDEDGVPFVCRHPGEELLPGGLGELRFVRHQDLGVRVNLQELGLPLVEVRVRYDVHGLLGEAHPLRLHAHDDHFNGLPQAHVLGNNHVPLRQELPDRVELEGAQRELLATEGGGQPRYLIPEVRAVPCWHDSVVHCLVVAGVEAGRPVDVVLEDPLVPPLLDRPLLRLRQSGRFVVPYLSSHAIFNDLFHHHCLLGVQ